MKNLFVFLATLSVAFSVSAQGPVRRVNTIAELQAIDPAAVAVGTSLTYEVTGYTSSNRWETPRLARWDSTSALAQDGISVFTTAGSGRWIFDDVANGVVDVTWANAIGNGTTDDTAAMLIAASVVPAGGILTAPAGRSFVYTNTLRFLSKVRINFKNSPLVFRSTSRKPAIAIGPAGTTTTNHNFALTAADNTFTTSAGLFTVDDMLLLYNNTVSPSNYNPGLMAFVTAESGTTYTLDRAPFTTFNVTNILRFADTPSGSVIENVTVDLSGATNSIGISAVGRDHVVKNCTVLGSGTTNDTSYIGIELRGMNIAAVDNYVNGILDAGNTSDRSGYGIFAAGDSITVERNRLENCKHDYSTSERKARSTKLRFVNNVVRNREDWEGLTDSAGSQLFLGAIDVHANVDDAYLAGNYVESWGRYNFSLRNGNFELVNNRSVMHTKSGLPFNQQHIGLAEAFVTRAVFQGNQFISPDGATLMYFAHADSAYTGIHSNMIFMGNSFDNGILSIDDFDATMAVTNKFADVIISGNRFYRPNGTTLLFSGPMSNAIVTGNIFTHGSSGVATAIPGDDTNNPARQIYVSGNSFVRATGTSGDVRVLSGPTNIIELGHNRFSDVPTQGFDGQVAVSRTPPSSYRYQLITADDNELLFNSTTGSGDPARLRWGGSGALLADNSEYLVSRAAATDRAFSSYVPGSFFSQYHFVIKADGLMSWSDGTNAAGIVFGPRRIEDLTNAVIRLSGGLGVTERADPITSAGATATLWLEEADTSKSLKIKWPDGNSTALWPNTNASFLNSQPGSYYLARSNQSGTISYTNITGLGALAVLNDAPTNNSLHGRSNGVWAIVPAAVTPTYSTGLTNSGTTVHGNYWPGANVEAITNGTQITFNALVNTNYLTNSWQIAIDSTIVLTPNVVDSTEINPAAAGTNLSFSLFNNSITTNKIDSTFHQWVLSQAGTSGVYVDGTLVTNIKTSADISFTTGSSEATPSLTATAVTPGSYSNATITVDSKGRLTAASVTPALSRSQLSVDGTYMVEANLADSSMIAVTAAGTNVSMTIPDGVITTNKVDSTFYNSLTPYLGKVRFRANPNALSGGEVTDITAKGCISTVLWSTYASALGCTYYDEYEIVISPALPSADYFVTIMIGGSSAAQTPFAGVRDNDDASYPLSTTGFKIWRSISDASGSGDNCLDDGNWVTVLISNY